MIEMFYVLPFDIPLIFYWSDLHNGFWCWGVEHAASFYILMNLFAFQINFLFSIASTLLFLNYLRELILFK